MVEKQLSNTVSSRRRMALSHDRLPASFQVEFSPAHLWVSLCLLPHKKATPFTSYNPCYHESMKYFVSTFPSLSVSMCFRGHCKRGMKDCLPMLFVSCLYLCPLWERRLWKKYEQLTQQCFETLCRNGADTEKRFP